MCAVLWDMLSQCEIENKMLTTTRVSRFLCPIHQAVGAYYRYYGVHRLKPLRFLDSEGNQIKHPLDVDPEPKPVNKKTADKQTAGRRQSKPRPNRAQSAVDSDALEFIKMVTAITSRNSKRNSADERHIVLEGEKLISDAFDAGIKIRKLYHDKDLSHFKRLQHVVELGDIAKKVTSSDMAIVSKLTTPPGLMAIAEKPSVIAVESKRSANEVMPVVTIGDTVTEAGNTGGLLRSMAASGASCLILSEQAGYPWDVKVLRSGAGAHFLVPIRTLSWDRIRTYLQTVDNVFYAENPSSPEADESVKLYHEISYFANPSTRVALFLGNESRGFCPEARQILKERAAQRITIPMSSRFDSLNNYVAATVILFEMRKQYDQIVASSKC